ncbi:MAG: RHS repeat-associated core domain-containing protein [Luteolibacter sp.]
MTNSTGYRWNSAFNQQNPPPDRYDLPIGLVSSAGKDEKGVSIFDCNGDGLPDILRHSKEDSIGEKTKWVNRGGHGAAAWVAETSTEGENSYTLPVPLHAKGDQNIRYPYGFELTDLNGDGLVDILYGNPESAFTPGPDNTVILNTGDGWKQREEWKLPGGNLFFTNWNDQLKQRKRVRVADINGDGFPDLFTDIEGRAPKIWLNQCRPEVLTSVTDGFGSELQVEYKRLNDPTPASPASGFGTAVYRKGAGAGALPEGQVSSLDGRLVVSRYSEPDGRGGRRYKSQRYSDLRFDRINQVSLGFGQIEAIDEATDQITETFLSRTYPFVGSPIETLSYVPVTSADLAANDLGGRIPGVTPGIKLLSREEAFYEEMPPQTGVGGVIRRMVQTKSIQTDYDLDGTIKSRNETTQPLSSFDAFGFVTHSTVVALDGSTVTTSSTYNHSIDASRWHLGRLTGTTVVKSGGGKPSITKTASFAYHSATGLLVSETVEPGHPLAVTKSYTRDSFGNIISTTVTTSGGSRGSSTVYDNRGRFVVRETNALGHQVNYHYDSQRALLLATVDPNGLTTSFSYDAFGTRILSHLPDNTRTAEITGYTNSAALPSSVSSQLTHPVAFFRARQSSGSPPVKVYLDAMGRELVSETTLLRNAGTAGSSRYSQVYQVTRYDHLGRKIAVSEPFASNETPRFITTAYDMIHRTLFTTHPDGTSDQLLEFGRRTLDGQIHTYSKTANRNGMILERWEDQHGRMVQSRDPSGQITAFQHDQEGKLLSVTLGGQTLLTNTYDLLGNKTSVSEANSGTSATVYNGFGEAISFTNAKGQTTIMTYDSLGRPVTRHTPEGFWTTYYDGAPGAGIGQPWKTSGPNGYLDAVSYDSLGRPIQTTMTRFGETFHTTTSYTALGQPLAEKNAGGLIVVHEYDPTYGFPVALRIGPGPRGAGTLLWKAGTFNSKGQPLSQTLAHGITTGASYNPNSGLLEGLYSSDESGNVLQNKACLWDSQGNLTSRTDFIAKLQETFSYDALNRLTGSSTALLPGATITTVPPPQGYSYDVTGNLLTKGGAVLAYQGARPHAVSSATIKGQSRIYQYDAAGYVTSDTLRTYDWTSFGQLRLLDYTAAPDLKDFSGAIVYGEARIQTTFDFDAGGNRARQYKERISTDDSRKIEDTFYLGGYERVRHFSKTDAAAAPWFLKEVNRHHLPGIGVFTVSYAESGSEARLSTVLKDHLGSTDVVYSRVLVGNSFMAPVIERQAFDAWGERRDATTGGHYRVTATDAFRTSSQNYDRGYTGHEQLDDSGLIHMNGRIYDPELGRFLSPDPFVQVPEYSQNFNRYSYVLNNPLNAIDPSGFSWLSKVFHKVKSWVKENWRTIVVIVVVAVLVIVPGGQAFVGAVAGALFPGAMAAGGLAATAATAAVVGGISGGLNAALNGGNAGDILRGMAIGAIQGAISGGILHGMEGAAEMSGSFWDKAAHVAGHGVVGGASNVAMGGKFEDGFLSAAAGAYARWTVMKNTTIATTVGSTAAGRTAMAGVVGGTVSVIGGGKFANGAWTASFQHLLNAEFWQKAVNGEFGSNGEGYDLPMKEKIPMYTFGSDPWFSNPELRSFMNELSSKYNISVKLLRAIIYNETGTRIGGASTEAYISSKSKYGTYGPAQLGPEARDFSSLSIQNSLTMKGALQGAAAWLGYQKALLSVNVYNPTDAQIASRYNQGKIYPGVVNNYGARIQWIINNRLPLHEKVNNY